MCLILFAYKAHPRYALVLAANRDEKYDRPTLPAAFWSDQPQVCGGRDLDGGGTWLGVTRGGRFAAVTNFRDGYAQKTGTRSRGTLVADFLCDASSPAEYARSIVDAAANFNGFNLLVGDAETMHYFSNRGHRAAPVEPGIHGLSNHLLDTPWPKVVRGKKILADLLHADESTIVDGLFDLLADPTIAPDDALPETGVGLHRERALSPAFIVSPNYGTRSSSVVLISYDGDVLFSERSFGPLGAPGLQVTRHFSLDPAAKVIGTPAM
jgi:uncharacterized protein with NRDE domain